MNGGANLSRLMTVWTVAVAATGCIAEPEAPVASFDVMEKSIRQLGELLATGEITSVELVRAYRERIERYDQSGPRINAVITLNPQAEEQAAVLDEERGSGTVRGPLHGIPVLVKDNYDTGDMPTTAGALGLATSVPLDDAFQVRRLKEAGAVILGKTNMHELARGITTVSSLAGQTRNPYDPTRNPGGSSGGTGAAVAASFAAVGMGSDTCGSIRIPSAHQALVGLRGTRGLASGDGIVPLSRTQDIGGPLARSVEDLAITLDATVGYDPADPVTALSEGHIPETYTGFLDPGSLRGARIGVATSLLGSGGGEEPVREVIEAAIETMRRLGAELMEVDEPDFNELTQGASVIGQEFRFDFDEYLAGTPGAPVHTLAELVSLGLYHQVVDGGLRSSLELDSLRTADYRERLAKRDEVRTTVIGLLTEHDLDALLYPTIRQTARPIGQGQPGSACQLSAVSGLPAITVPAGFAQDDMPVGLELLGAPWSEPRLIGLAYAFERATQHRRPPDFTPSLLDSPMPVDLVGSAVPSGGESGEVTLVFEPTTHVLRYRIALDALQPADVLSIDLHGAVDDSGVGPVLRHLDGGKRAIVGEVILGGREVHLLREGSLYLDVHTREQLTGTLRIDLGPFPPGN